MGNNSILSCTWRLGAVAGILCLSLFTAACFGDSTPALHADAETSAVGTASSRHAGTAAVVPEATSVANALRCPAPLRVGVLLDKSGSVHENVVPQMTEDELDDLIGLVNTCAGGEVAVGVLCNISGDKPFVRLFLSAQNVASRAAAPADSSDPFTALKLARAAAAAAAQRHAAEEREAEVRRTQIDHFREQALALVQAPTSCTRTDVVSGANRLLTYLAEPLPVAGVAAVPKRVGVYVTDASDNVRRQTLRHDADLDAAYLLVGGSPDAGALAPLNPSRFESIGAALRWIQAAATAR